MQRRAIWLVRSWWPGRGPCSSCLNMLISLSIAWNNRVRNWVNLRINKREILIQGGSYSQVVISLPTALPLPAERQREEWSYFWIAGANHHSSLEASGAPLHNSHEVQVAVLSQTRITNTFCVRKFLQKNICKYKINVLRPWLIMITENWIMHYIFPEV